jgi:hypothetical protein
MSYRVQVRYPGKRYRSVHSAETLDAAAWMFKQYLTADGVASVRVVDVTGEVVARAVPKGGAK